MVLYKRGRDPYIILYAPSIKKPRGMISSKELAIPFVICKCKGIVV